MALIANRRSVMTLFSDPICPHSHRVRLVLAEKSINVDIVSVAEDGERTTWRFAAEAPGSIVARRVAPGPEVDETRVVGHWLGGCWIPLPSPPMSWCCSVWRTGWCDRARRCRCRRSCPRRR